MWSAATEGWYGICPGHMRASAGSEPVPVQDRPGAVPVSSDITRGRRAHPAIELSQVTFSYPGRRRPALDGVSLTIPVGSTVALVGSSGAGKTTIAHLCLRFWDPDTGAGRAALDLGLGALRAVAYAPDGLTVVAGGDAGTAAIVDAE